MQDIKISEIMRITGLSLEEIANRFSKSDITIDSPDQCVSIDQYKHVMSTPKSSPKISLKRNSGSKLELKPKADKKGIITGKAEETSFITSTTLEQISQFKQEKLTHGSDFQKPDHESITKSAPASKSEIQKETTDPITPKQVAKTQKNSSNHETKAPVNNSGSKAGIDLPETMTVSDLAQSLGLQQTQILKTLFDLGIMAGINHILDFDTAAIIADELGFNANQKQSAKQIISKNPEDIFESTGEQSTRPPVVTIMGHVDHGKTSLLDKIRSSNVVASEAGGITQHIGAYQITTPKGVITFLDTPGHEAFTSMRARGANVTDIVILVVSADDGVMPQTVEAIQHAKAANVPIIVAITKIDKGNANIESIKSQLAANDVLLEDWGGEVQSQPVSSHTGEGINELLDAILLQAEVLELKARSQGPATGTIIETRLDTGTGPVATILVKHGILNQSDAILVGNHAGKIRRMTNDLGKPIKHAGPSTPVEIFGLSGLPGAGDLARVVSNEKEAKRLSEELLQQLRHATIHRKPSTSLDDLFVQHEGEKKYLNIILKADVTGSLEALEQAISKLGTEEVNVKLISTGVGGINESDAQLARASNAVMIGFNIRADSGAKKVIDAFGIRISYYSIIYDLIKHIKQLVRGIAGPKYDEEIIGLAEVRDVFRSSRFGAIAGCIVTEGVMKRNAPVRVLRDNVVIYQGKLESLRRMKNDVLEVRNGIECGIGIKDYNDIKPKDQIEAFVHKEIIVTEDD
ncbi:MAG: translation initiation factor IF-2 [Gammaproteobacteria bacterium]|nr:translation initiation factor IF-2 [Gammaproteobacteria bacterium]